MLLLLLLLLKLVLLLILLLLLELLLLLVEVLLLRLELLLLRLKTHSVVLELLPPTTWRRHPLLLKVLLPSPLHLQLLLLLLKLLPLLMIHPHLRIAVLSAVLASSVPHAREEILLLLCRSWSWSRGRRSSGHGCKGISRSAK